MHTAAAAYLRGERCIRLVELIDANRKKTVTGKGWQAIGRMLVEETHHCTGSRRHHLRYAVQAVVAMKVRLRVARRYTHTVHLRRGAEQGGT
jgi:hypothetical protein